MKFGMTNTLAAASTIPSYFLCLSHSPSAPLPILLRAQYFVSQENNRNFQQKLFPFVQSKQTTHAFR